MSGIPNHLTSSHPAEICRDDSCPEAVKRDPATGRFFITMGHPGFNSPTNNARGYRTEKTARSAVRLYLFRGSRGLGEQASPTARGILAALRGGFDR